jgi:hypothetical protein
MQAETKPKIPFALIICGIFLLFFSYVFAVSANERCLIQPSPPVALSCAAKDEAQIPTFSTDLISERKIALQESHYYQCSVPAGQYLRIMVRQNDIEVFNFSQQMWWLRVSSKDRTDKTALLFGIARCKRQKGNLSVVKPYFRRGIQFGCCSQSQIVSATI